MRPWVIVYGSTEGPEHLSGPASDLYSIFLRFLKDKIFSSSSVNRFLDLPLLLLSSCPLSLHFKRKKLHAMLTNMLGF